VALAIRFLVVVALVSSVPAPLVRTQSASADPVTTPAQQFGANVGDDYFLATYTQLEEYWARLARESDRLRVVDIGRTEEGRRQWMAVVSSPENLERLDRYRSIARRLALAEGVSDADARALAAEGRAVVWIDGGLHADEVLGAQQLIETVYQLVSRSDDEMLRILRDVIVLAVHANPDGHELVAGWYMRERQPALRSLAGVPRPYQKYVGHDNNRDFYMATQAETINMNRILYQEWFPQIVYNHHQTGPPGTVMFAPPFRDPFNYVLDPLIPVGIDLIGAAIHGRFAAEGKAGVTMRNGSPYSTWWNGGLRTTAYFHNQIGLLTETIGSPTPIDIPFVPERQLPSGDLPHPIAPQRWHFRQSIEYSLTANWAVLDAASRYREALLYNVYRMGRNGIERGSRDAWTASPRRIDAARAAASRSSNPAAAFQQVLRDPARRDARGYILPSDQPDFITATRFVEALLKNGVTVHRAVAPFRVNGKAYPEGSYVVFTAQAFRPHVLDMFEPQDHPHDAAYPGGPPVPPYDSAGWTLAFQMGIDFDRVLDGFTGPFEKVGSVVPPAGRVVREADASGFFVSHHQNDAFAAVNRLLAAGERVYWPLDRSAGGFAAGTGAMYIPARASTLAILQRAAADRGLAFVGTPFPPAGGALALEPVRIALWDRYGGASTSGWTRWLLERFEFDFDVVYPQQLDAGNLASRYDVVILTDEAEPSEGRRTAGNPPPERLPAEYREMTGAITRERTVPRLREFVAAGGTLIAIGDSTSIAPLMGVPVESALVERAAGSTRRPLPRERYYVPGSVLRIRVDNSTPLGFGFERDVDVFFNNSPVFRFQAGSPAASARNVAWFADATPLRSGWAWGQQYLESGLAVVDATLGRGRVLLFGPEIAFRAQSHGTFKFLFNAIYYSRARAVPSIAGVR
jgi:hypothetical protein